MQERQLIFQKPLYHAVLTLFNFNIAHGHAVSLTINKFLKLYLLLRKKLFFFIHSVFKILFKLTNTII